MSFYQTSKDQKAIKLNGSCFYGLDITGSATWTLAKASDVVSYDQTAAVKSAAFEINLSQYVPQDERIGATVDKVVLHYSVATTALTALTAEFHEVAYHATTTVPSSTLVAASGTLTKTAGTFAITLTPASTLRSKQDSIIQLEIASTTASDSVFKLIGLDIYYTPAGE